MVVEIVHCYWYCSLLLSLFIDNFTCVFFYSCLFLLFFAIVVVHCFCLLLLLFAVIVIVLCYCHCSLLLSLFPVIVIVLCYCHCSLSLLLFIALVKVNCCWSQPDSKSFSLLKNTPTIYYQVVYEEPWLNNVLLSSSLLMFCRFGEKL